MKTAIEIKKMKQVLASLKTRADIKSAKVLDQFEDDHMMCAEVEINGCHFEFNYTEFGCVYYADESEKAFADLKFEMNRAIEFAEEGL